MYYYFFLSLMFQRDLCLNCFQTKSDSFSRNVFILCENCRKVRLLHWRFQTIIKNEKKSCFFLENLHSYIFFIVFVRKISRHMEKNMKTNRKPTARYKNQIKNIIICTWNFYFLLPSLCLLSFLFFEGCENCAIYRSFPHTEYHAIKIHTNRNTILEIILITI